jgi:hypothetical protein
MAHDDKRKPGDLIRTFGDFWLGMVGAAAKGVSTFSEARRAEKSGRDPDLDFFTNAASAVGAMFVEANDVAEETRREIREGKKDSDPEGEGTVSVPIKHEKSLKVRTTT